MFKTVLFLYSYTGNDFVCEVYIAK